MLWSLILVILACSWADETDCESSSFSSSEWRSEFDVVEIEALQWPSEEEGEEAELRFAEQLVQSEIPVLVKNARPVREWPASNKWNDDDHLREAFLDASPIEGLVMRSDQSSFFYSTRSAPLVQWSMTELREPFGVIDSIDANEFLERIKLINKSDAGSEAAEDVATEFLYLSRPIRRLSERLWQDVQPLWPLKRFDGTTEEDDETEEDPRVTLWCSSAGATARMHYDSSANLFVQVRGEKRFLLVDPRHSSQLQMYSFAHPGHRQTAFDPSRIDEVLSPDEFPMLAEAASDPARRIPAISVTVAPGDLVFIPPFWFHHVQVLDQDASLSVNMFQPSPLKHIGRDAFDVAVPIDHSWQPEARVVGVVRLLRAVWKASGVGQEPMESGDVEGDEDIADGNDEKEATNLSQSIKEFAIELVKSRWNHMTSVDEILSFKHPDFRFSHSPELKKMCRQDQLLSEKQRNAMDDVGAKVGGMFAKLPANVRPMIVADYFERWAVIGGMDKLPFFIQFCIGMDKSE